MSSTLHVVPVPAVSSNVHHAVPGLPVVRFECTLLAQPSFLPEEKLSTAACECRWPPDELPAPPALPAVCVCCY